MSFNETECFYYDVIMITLQMTLHNKIRRMPLHQSKYINCIRMGTTSFSFKFATVNADLTVANIRFTS